MLPIPRRNADLHRARRVIVQPEDAGLEDADLVVDGLALGRVQRCAAEVLVAVELLARGGEDPRVGLWGVGGRRRSKSEIAG